MKDVGRIKNPWGQVLEAQRTDLFKVDFRPALIGLIPYRGLYGYNSGLPTEVFVRDISFPAQVIKTEEIRMGSVPYLWPTWDEALQQVKITFDQDAYDSEIWKFLQTWRDVVRAGVDGVSNVQLDRNFKYNYCFTLEVSFLKGVSNGIQGTGMEVCSVYVIENAWPSQVQLGDLSYNNGTSFSTILTSFNCSNILKLARSA